MEAAAINQTQCDISDHVTNAVECGDWRQVAGWMRNGDLNDLDRRWVVRQACASCRDEFYMAAIVQHSDSDLQDVLLTHIVSRGLWWALGKLLEQGSVVRDSQKQRLLQEGCKKASDKYIAKTLLPHCAVDRLTDLLGTLLQRHLWHSVRTVLLQLGNSASDPQVTEHVIQEACRHADGKFIANSILPLCADDHLDCAVKLLVERGLWRCVDIALRRGVTDSLQWWAMQEACKRAGDHFIQTRVLPFCTPDQRNTLLTTVVERRLTLCISVMLRQGVSPSRRQWAVEQASHWAEDAYFARVMAAYIDDVHLDPLLMILLERSLWNSVGIVLRHSAATNSKHIPWSIPNVWETADECSVIQHIIPSCIHLKLDTAIQQFAARGLWAAVGQLLHRCAVDTMHRWVVADDNVEPDDEAFWDVIKTGCVYVKPQLLEKVWVRIDRCTLPYLRRRLNWASPCCAILGRAAIDVVKETWTNAQRKEWPVDSSVAVEQAKSVLTKLNDFIQENKTEVEENGALHILQYVHNWHRSNVLCMDVGHVLCAVHFMKLVMKHLHKRSQGETEAILVILATVPVLPQVQSVLLREMVRHKKWDVITQACVSRVWEQDRRQLFRAAVKVKQWSAVRQWANHTVCKHQRVWAVEEAFKEKQWDIVLLLAEHGLTDSERVDVYCRLVRQAEWSVVLGMLETAGDVSQIEEVLAGQLSEEMSSAETRHLHPHLCQLKKFGDNLLEKCKTVSTLRSALEQGQWYVARRYLCGRHNPLPDHVSFALRAGVTQKAWHFVMQLARQAMDANQRDCLFREMVSLQQWAVCMVLLERGVSATLCVERLPELTERNQWSLVARVMQTKEVGDASRQKVMQHAMEVREGGVVAQCISNMQRPLSAAERETLYQQALDRNMWPALEGFVQEKDATGIHHRDTGMLLAIEHGQWDVVDVCQHHHADINMPDSEGYSPIQRAALSFDWQSVVELKVRGAGPPTVVTSQGLSLLQMAIGQREWEAVNVLVQYRGDINQTDRTRGLSAVQMLIDYRRADQLEMALTWHPDQHGVVNSEGETPLHAACLSARPGALKTLVAMNVNPFALTRHRSSALLYAVCNTVCPQEMVAECLRLGFSTHQSHITDAVLSDCTWRTPLDRRDFFLWLASPVLLSAVRGLPVLTRMLYESGSCSSTELHMLRTLLPDITNRGPSVDRFQFAVHECLARLNNNYFFLRRSAGLDWDTVNTSADYLMKVSAAPRSLLAACRLVISRHVHDSCSSSSKRCPSDAVNQLSLPDCLKGYVLFSDLTDPQFGGGGGEEKPVTAPV